MEHWVSVVFKRSSTATGRRRHLVSIPRTRHSASAEAFNLVFTPSPSYLLVILAASLSSPADVSRSPQLSLQKTRLYTNPSHELSLVLRRGLLEGLGQVNRPRLFNRLDLGSRLGQVGGLDLGNCLRRGSGFDLGNCLRRVSGLRLLNNSILRSHLIVRGLRSKRLDGTIVGAKRDHLVALGAMVLDILEPTGQTRDTSQANTEKAAHRTGNSGGSC